jgi:uncharacterized membrane protein YeaQ/YmgE (transglycosylase-associated protein family)
VERCTGSRYNAIINLPHNGRYHRFTQGILMLSIIGTIIVGLIVGLIARALKPGDDKLGWIMTAVLGIAGSFLAGYIGQAMGWYTVGQPAGWIASIIGAIILLVIWGLFTKRRS